MDIMGFEGDDILDVVYKKTLRKRSCWVRKYYEERNISGGFVVQFQQLKMKDPVLFQQYCRMGCSEFEELLKVVGPLIKKQHFIREPIPTELRLIITLRYLATGESQRSLGSCYKCSPSVVCKIIVETVEKLSQALYPEVFPHISMETFLGVAQQFEAKWQFPNCIGALDGKHIQIKAPPNSGTTFFNYKKSNSLILMAIADADYKFTMCEIGASGRESDNGAFARCKFGQMFYQRKFPIPPPRDISDNCKNMPYVIVADDAFPLEENLMKPYSHRQLTEEERVFNYRLSRARRVVENAFGILVARWRIFRAPIDAKVETVEGIIKATVCLHNWLRIKNCSYYITNDLVSDLNRNESNLQNIQTLSKRNSRNSSKQIRDCYKNYFVNEGAVSWQ